MYTLFVMPLVMIGCAMLAFYLDDLATGLFDRWAMGSRAGHGAPHSHPFNK